MSSGDLGSRRLRFDSYQTVSPQPTATTRAAFESQKIAREVNEKLPGAIEKTTDWLLQQQHADGHWCAELEGDTILESEYLLLLAFLKQEQSVTATKAANYILSQQMHEGGWATYPGGPIEISGSVKAYFALKLTGHSPDAEYMLRARNAIRQAGGVEKVNSFTRFYLALLGVIQYEQCPAVPPELILIPKWSPFNIYEMSAWSRTIIVPLSIMWAFRPSRQLAPEQGIDELFIGKAKDLPACMPLENDSFFSWRKFFSWGDRIFKRIDKMRIRPFRKWAIQQATDWMTERFANSDGLGAIFPPIVWSVVALKCLGHDEDSPLIQSAMKELDRLMIDDGETIRLQPCKSPVWDTALTTIALRDAGVPRDNPAIRQSVQWMLSKEARRKGDWAERDTKTMAGGWFFEYHNEFYPDVDDTSMVLMALIKSLPTNSQQQWRADFLVEDWSPDALGNPSAAIVSTRNANPAEVLDDIQTLSPTLTAIWRGARWVLAMQGSDGGWGAFDKDNNRELFTKVPFADHNAMIDPSTADLTSRVLEMFGMLGAPPDYPAMQNGIDFCWKEQEADNCWFGRWGVNYIYGTWQTIVGLTAIGIPTDDRRIQAASDWLLEKQQECGGWGESPLSYDDPTYRGEGSRATASQTAWALMGLIAAGEAHSEAVLHGVQFLLTSQNKDGTWSEETFTGTGFPKVFYLKYHYYPIYFPLMALAKFAKIHGG